MKRNIESEVSQMWSKFFPSNEQIIKFLIRMKVEATVTNKFKKWKNDRKAELNEVIVVSFDFIKNFCTAMFIAVQVMNFDSKNW